MKKYEILFKNHGECEHYKILICGRVLDITMLHEGLLFMDRVLIDFDGEIKEINRILKGGISEIIYSN